MLIITNNSNRDTYDRTLTLYEKTGLKAFVESSGIKLEPDADLFFQAVATGNYETAELWMTDTLELLLFYWWMESKAIRQTVFNYGIYLKQKRYNLY